MTVGEEPMADREKGLRALSGILWTISSGMILGSLWALVAVVVVLGVCDMGVLR